MSGYVKTAGSGLRDEIEHLDGISWHQAPVPGRWHRCWPQTRGWLNYFSRFERCACGAARYDGRGWISKNETRKAAKR